MTKKLTRYFIDKSDPINGSYILNLDTDFIEDKRAEVLRPSNTDEKKAILTNFGKYIAISQAKKTFRNLLDRMDTGEFLIKTNSTIKDSGKQKELESKFSKELATLKKFEEDWKKGNKDLYYNVPSVASPAPFIGGFKFTGVKSAKEAVEGYKYSNSLLLGIDKMTLPVILKKNVQPGMKDEYAKVMSEKRSSLGIPTSAEFGKMAGMSPAIKTNLAIGRKPCEDMAPFSQFTLEMLEFFATTKY